MSDLSHTSEDDDNVRGLVLGVVVVHVWCVVHVSDADAWLRVGTLTCVSCV